MRFVHPKKKKEKKERKSKLIAELFSDYEINYLFIYVGGPVFT